MSLLTLDQGVPLDFKERLTEQLMNIREFLHMIVKEQVSTNRRAGRHHENDDSGSVESSDNEEDLRRMPSSQHKSSNLGELF